MERQRVLSGSGNRVGNENLRAFLLVGAYRDSAIDDSHPLMLTLAEVVRERGPLPSVELGNLSPGDVDQLVSDTLSPGGERTRPLAEWVYKKTRGNAFFTTEFLKSLHGDGLLFLDAEADIPVWRWDLDAIRAQPITDNVVELMAAKIGRFEPATRQLLHRIDPKDSCGRAAPAIHPRRTQPPGRGLIDQNLHTQAKARSGIGL